MSNKKKENKNIIFVSLFLISMLLFMLGTVIYVTNQVANCSSVKKARKMCKVPCTKKRGNAIREIRNV